MEAEQQNVENSQQQNTEEQTFTQQQLQEAINKRLEKERKKYPSKEELEAFHEWKQSQKSQQQKWDDLQNEKNDYMNHYNEAQKELQQMKRERYLITKGVPADDAEYHVFKISKGMQSDDDFETAAENYLKNKKVQNTTTVHFGTNADKGSANLSLGEEINRKLRGH